MNARIVIPTLILIFFSQLIYSQESKALFLSVDELIPAIVYLSQDSIETVTIEDKKFEIWYKRKDGKEAFPKTLSITGTGFFISTEKNLYLVTASHVANNIKNTAKVVVKGENDNAIVLNIRDLAGKENIEWKHHKEADVAVLKLYPSQNVLTNYLQKRFIPSNLLEDSLIAPKRDIVLTVIGFPLILGIGQRISPLTLQTHTSSGLLELNRFDNKILTTFFICENPSIGGFSGAPCFDISIYKIGAMTATGKGTKCYGLMHGTISDETGGKLSAVVPSFFIRELIEKLENGL